MIDDFLITASEVKFFRPLWSDDLCERFVRDWGEGIAITYMGHLEEMIEAHEAELHEAHEADNQ